MGESKRDRLGKFTKGNLINLGKRKTSKYTGRENPIIECKKPGCNNEFTKYSVYKKGDK